MTLDAIDYRPIPSAPGYGATSAGDIIRIKPGMGTRVGKVLKPLSNVSKPHREAGRKGYYRVNVGQRENGYPRAVMVHRLVCEAWHGPPPSPGLQAAHLNGIKDDNRPSNLAWKTPQENAADKRRHGTDLIGARSHNSKLDPRKVRHIRKKKAAGTLDVNRLAEHYDVAPATIRAAADGRTWSWLLQQQELFADAGRAFFGSAAA